MRRAVARASKLVLLCCTAAQRRANALKQQREDIARARREQEQALGDARAGYAALDAERAERRRA